MISIVPFEERYAQDVIDLVLHFQNDGTRPMVTVDDQPDLRNIVDSYMHAGGNFWIAVENDRDRTNWFHWHYAMQSGYRNFEKILCI